MIVPRTCTEISARDNDRNHLEAMSPNGKVTVLRLNPLTDSDIAQLLEAHSHVDDAEAFIAEADRRGIGDLLRNPQTLDLLAKAVVDGNWPESRKETFEMACVRMVREHNDEHSAAMASSNPPAPDQLLDAAGRLCAVPVDRGEGRLHVTRPTGQRGRVPHPGPMRRRPSRQASPCARHQAVQGRIR